MENGNVISAQDAKALGLIHGSGSGRGLTDAASAFVGRHASALLSKGFIRYDSSRWVGYAVTKSGLSACVEFLRAQP